MKKFSFFFICACVTILASCNESEEWVSKTGCADDETRCDGDNLYVCKDAAWVIASHCAEGGKICGNNGELKSACIDASVDVCVPSCKAGKVTHCNSDGSASIEICKAGQVCGLNASGVPACVNETEVKSCTPMCKDGQLTTCDEDMNLATSACGENEVCGFDVNGVPACVEKAVPVVCAFHDGNMLIGDKACDDEGNVVECLADGTMSDGVACTEGVCDDGRCVRRSCDEIADGQNTCQGNKLMVCDDGDLKEDVEHACGEETPLCRDGEAACSAYKMCDAIEHGQNGCKDSNIVVCNDGVTTVIEEGECVKDGKYCVSDDGAQSGFICKEPEPTDCTFDDAHYVKGDKLCDGMVLRTCSAEKDGELSEGVACDADGSTKPVCDSKLRVCRAYKNCGENDEIAHESIVCNAKGTNKAKCVDGRLVDLTGDEACAEVDNASSVCIFESEAECSFVCKTGYFLKNNACELIVTCDPVKEKYDAETNSCECNEAAFWTGKPGECICQDGYLEIGNICATKAVCSDKHSILDEKVNICVCDFEHHWIGNVASCQCEDGFVELNETCEAVTSCTIEHSVWVKESNTCACDAAGHWTKKEGSDACECSRGYVSVGDECQLKRTCDLVKEVYRETTNTCECDADHAWTGSAGQCECVEGTVLVGNECQRMTKCEGAGQKYVSNANICVCDAEKGWIGDGETCRCPDKYIAKDGECILKAVCDVLKEKYDNETNSCECNADRFWTKVDEECECMEGKIEIKGVCVDKASCSESDNEIWAAPNQCICKAGYVLVNGKCEVKASCDLSRNEIWSEPNQCVCKHGSTIVNDEIVCKVSCSVSEHLTWGAPNQCICQNGYFLTDKGCSNTFKAGDIIKFGIHKKSVIEWIVLEDSASTSNEVFVLSKNVLLDGFDFGTSTNVWTNSFIREYLNQIMYYLIFTSDEKGRILETTLPDVPKDDYGHVVSDYMFNLSKTEYEVYKDIVPGVKLGSKWWLRTETDEADKTYAVDDDDAVKAKRYDSGRTENIGIRPAMKVRKVGPVAVTCDAAKHQVLDNQYGTCVCDEANGWHGDSESCECPIFKVIEGGDDVCVATKQLSVGDVITFGTGKSGITYSSYVDKPLSWVVLEKTSGDALIVSRDVIAEHAYGPYLSTPNVWGNSALRDWLNNSFLSVFTEVEKSRINLTTVDFGTDDESEDMVFVLSFDQYIFSSVYMYISGMNYCWTRDSVNGYNAYGIDEYGLETISMSVDEILSIRPAMRIK